MNNTMPKISERILAALTYLSGGMIGIIWLIVTSIRGNLPSRFGLYHIMQAIFISLCYVIINWIFWTIMDLLSYIPFLNRLLRQIIFLFNSPFLMGYSIMQCLIYGTLIYLVVFAAMGLYAYVPFFSDVIKSHFKD